MAGTKATGRRGTTKPKASSARKPSPAAGSSRTPRKPRATKKETAAAAAASVSSTTTTPSGGKLLPPPITNTGGPLHTLILDTGGWSIKHGTVLQQSQQSPLQSKLIVDSTSECASTPIHDTSSTNTNSNSNTNNPQEPSQSPNVSAKAKHQLTTLLSDQINNIHNKSQLQVTFPQERGYTTDLGVQLQIWGHVLDKEGLDCHHPYSNGGVPAFFPSISNNKKVSKNSSSTKKKKRIVSSTMPGVEQDQQTIMTHACSILLLSQPFTPRSILEREDEVWFRDFGFGRVARRLGQCCSAYRYLRQLHKTDDMQQPQDVLLPPDTASGGVVHDDGRVIAADGDLMGKAAISEGLLGTTKDDNKVVIQSNTVMTSSSTTTTNITTTSDATLYNNGIIDDETGCCCVVDSGFSLTHIVPTFEGRAIETAIRRINIGGKLLTNHLKELISYRQWNMMDEFYIVNEVKETLCFVSPNFSKEIADARRCREGARWFDRNYVLPDFVETFRGIVRLPRMLQMEKDMEEWDGEERKRKRAVMMGKREKKKKRLAGEMMDSSIVMVDKNVDGYKHDEKVEERPIKSKKDKSKQKEDKMNSTNAQLNNNNNNQKKKKKNLKQKYEDDDDDDDDDNYDCDSDNETNDQVRRRILKQRHAEILRRELEEQERQVLSLSVERFAVPEVLFRPSDIGLRQVGIAEGICQSIEACDPIYRAAMYHNVILTGGTVQLPYFKERLEMELRALAPTNYEIRVYVPDDPVNYAWKGAQDLVQSMNGSSAEGYLDRSEWETQKKAGNDTGDIWDSKNGNKTCEGHITI